MVRSSFGSIHSFALSFLSSLVLALSLVSRVSASVSEWLSRALYLGLDFGG